MIIVNLHAAPRRCDAPGVTTTSIPRASSLNQTCADVRCENAVALSREKRIRKICQEEEVGETRHCIKLEKRARWRLIAFRSLQHPIFRLLQRKYRHVTCASVNAYHCEAREVTGFVMERPLLVKERSTPKLWRGEPVCASGMRFSALLLVSNFDVQQDALLERVERASNLPYWY